MVQRKLGKTKAKLSKDALIVRNKGTLPAPARKRPLAVIELKSATITKITLRLHQNV